MLVLIIWRDTEFKHDRVLLGTVLTSPDRTSLPLESRSVCRSHELFESGLWQELLFASLILLLLPSSELIQLLHPLLLSE